MRLTLRTLLAWMDDTLPASEVREIGKQMSESPFARELSDRINRVARQRRLTVPSESSPDFVDANTVAAYLDNELPPEEVTDYEKVCLKSDVHLAEVASVHQILSLIGQKAKVPPEARHRMYRLVKGREAVQTRAPSAFAPSHDEIKSETKKKRVMAPKAEWTPGKVSRATEKSLTERFGLGAAVVGLMGILVFAAMRSLDHQGHVHVVAPQVPQKQVGGPEDGKAIAVAPESPPEKLIPRPPQGGDDQAKPEAKKEEIAKVEVPTKEAAEPKVSNLPKFAKLEGAVFFSESADSPWKPVEPDAALKVGETIINLTPGWPLIQFGPVDVSMRGAGQIGVVGKPGTKNLRPRIDLGRVVLHHLDRETPFEIDYRGKTLVISDATATSIGIEVRPATLAGTADVAPPSLRIAIPDGQATLTWGMATTKLSGESSTSLLPTDQFAEHQRQAPPTWVTDTAPSAFDSQTAERLLKSLRPGRPLVASLVEAREDEDKEIRRLSIAALGVLGNADMIVPVLNETNDATSRKAAVDALRDLLARDTATRKQTRAELEKAFGQNAEITEKLLAGFTPVESKEETTLAKLVQLLVAPDLGTRALAIDSLKVITGRDNMEYDPAVPEGRGLTNWRDLFMKKESRKTNGNSGGERVPPPPAPKSR